MFRFVPKKNINKVLMFLFVSCCFMIFSCATSAPKKEYTGDPSGVLIGTWSSLMSNDLKFEGNKFMMTSGAGNSIVNVLVGTFSYNDGVILLNVTEGILSKNWLGEQKGRAIVDGDTLTFSEFQGDQATTFNVFPFTRKN